MSSPTINERIETFLAAIAAEAGAPDAAETHIEMWLAYILSKLGGSGEYAGLNGLVKYETLWENASPTSSFAEQTLNIDTSEYDHILVISRYSTGDTTTQEVSGTYGNFLQSVFFLASFMTFRYIRPFSSGVYFTEAYYRQYTSATAVQDDAYNVYVIPTKIIGVKVVS